MMKVIVLHSSIAIDAPPDEQDTLTTARQVHASLRRLGNAAVLLPFHLDVKEWKATLVGNSEVTVFNLVESVEGIGAMAPTAASLLEATDTIFTGSSGAVLAITGDKLLLKRVLRSAGFATPDWTEGPDWNGLKRDRCYIVKSATEDASLGLGPDSVVQGLDQVVCVARSCKSQYRGRWFAEEYLKGDEYSVTIMEIAGQCVVLAVSKLRFLDWPEQSARIVSYAAKWATDTDAYQRTVRSFDRNHVPYVIAHELAEIAAAAWQSLGIRGYARIDFRYDDKCSPNILDVNVNPGLARDGGFAAALEHAGYTYDQGIEMILVSASKYVDA